MTDESAKKDFETAWNTYITNEKNTTDERKQLFKKFWNLDLKTREKKYKEIKKYYKKVAIGKYLSDHMIFVANSPDDLPRTIKAALLKNPPDQTLLDKEIKFERKVLGFVKFFDALMTGQIEFEIKKWRKENKTAAKTKKKGKGKLQEEIPVYMETPKFAKLKY